MEKLMSTDTTVTDKSSFEGNALGWFGVNLLVFFGSLLTIGIARPWLICFRHRYIVSRTVINGHRLYFDGTGGGLLGKSFLWGFLTVITFFIYRPWVKVKRRKWLTSHVHFVGVQGGVSDFDGSVFGLFGLRLLANLCTILTLGIASFWMHCRKERYYALHTSIDGCRLTFTGTGLQYMGKKIVWCLLSVLTLGIYTIWLKIRSRKWTTAHTFAEHPEYIRLDTEALEKIAQEEARRAALRQLPEWKLSSLFFILGIASLTEWVPPIIFWIISIKKAKAVERYKLRKAAMILIIIWSALLLGVFLFLLINTLLGILEWDLDWGYIFN